MTEAEDCRYCGDCCTDCIFLEIDKKNKMSSCLIYENEYRVLLPSRLVLQVFIDDGFIYDDYHRKRLENILKDIAEGSNKAGLEKCDGYVCDEMKHGKLKLNIKKDEQHYKHVLHRKELIERARKLIPKFPDLVEILSAV